MLEAFATDVQFWNMAALVTGVVAIGAWGIATGGTADMTDAQGRRLGFPLSNFRYWRYLSVIFSIEFIERQKPSRRWSVQLARLAFWLQLVWFVVIIRTAWLNGPGLA